MRPNGYAETIQKGLAGVRALGGSASFGTGDQGERMGRLRSALAGADAAVVGAGAGLSTSAGLIYSAERFPRCFFDFAAYADFPQRHRRGRVPYLELGVGANIPVIDGTEVKRHEGIAGNQA